MAKRNGKRKRWKDKGTPKSAAVPMPSRGGLSRVQTHRGQPKRVDVGPTPETLRNLRPDMLRELVLVQLITPDEAAAGREILDAWEIIVADVDTRGASWAARIPGKNHVESRQSIWLQAVWRLWAPEVEKRCGCPPSWVPEWIAGKRYGHANLIARAIRWWELVAMGVGRHRSTKRTSGAGIDGNGPSEGDLQVA